MPKSRPFGRIYREPIVQLVAVGALLFGVDLILNRADDSQVIRVDDANLMTYMQFTSRAFDAERFRMKFDELSADELAELASSYVTEEALVRRGRELGLDQNDYVARRRLVTQMKYVVEAQAEAGIGDVSQDEVRQYFQKHRADFVTPEKISFDHVFFSRETDAKVIRRARTELRAGADWKILGERFAYGRSMSMQTRQQIDAIFGKAFEEAIKTSTLGEWREPVESKWGSHLIRVTGTDASRKKAFGEVSREIAEAIIRSDLKKLKEDQMSDIMKQYDIVIADPIQERLNDR